VAERTVLHVLPHPGGGGEAYVRTLEGMDGYDFACLYLGPTGRPSLSLAGGVARALRDGRGHDLVHVHGEVASGLCLPLLATRPSVATLHGLHLVRRSRGVRRTAAELNLRAVLRAADSTICVSEAEYSELVRVLGSNAARTTVVVRNGVRIPAPPSEGERAAVREELGIASQEAVAIWVGSLDERKDPLTAVRAAEAASVTLLVVGDGPLRSQAERGADRRVRVLGQRDDVPRLLAAADFYVLTSRREGLALSLLEAMARGLPPVVTDLPENREAVGDAGIGVSAQDEEALAAAFRRLAENEGDRAVLGARARRRAAALFDAADMIERTREVYEAVLAH
jgi:glycosyltransferase involved in cell wall biosynthesis